MYLDACSNDVVSGKAKIDEGWMHAAAGRLWFQAVSQLSRHPTPFFCFDSFQVIPKASRVCFKSRKALLSLLGEFSRRQGRVQRATRQLWPGPQMLMQQVCARLDLRAKAVSSMTYVSFFALKHTKRGLCKHQTLKKYHL